MPDKPVTVAAYAAGASLAAITLFYVFGPTFFIDGIGDDCAIVSRPRGPALFTIDSLVENVHFDLRWCPPDALGARALAVNLSDIAAMGGTSDRRPS